MLMALLAVAFGGGTTIHVMVSGDEVLVNHGEYCSYPRLAGVTTEASKALEERAWDGIFDPEALKRGFTGLVRYDGETAVGAAPLLAQTDLRSPGLDLAAWRELLEPCRMATMEGQALPELLRKLSPDARDVVVRVLANEALATSCGASRRQDVLETAFACGTAKCGSFVELLGELHGAKRCD